VKKLVVAIILGLGLVGAALISLSQFASEAHARSTPNEENLSPLSHRPPPQVGTGVLRVAPTGTDTAGCGSAIAPCQTVQFAVDEAKPGDEILIAGGLYAGVHVRNGATQTVYIDKPLTLRGGYTTTDKFTLSDPRRNPTTLDAQRRGRVVFITDTVAAILENLTLTQGSVDGLSLCSDVTRNCGGGIFATGPLTLINVDVANNFAERFGGGVAALTTTTVTGGRFTNNATGSGFGQGGGLYSEGPTTINRAHFIDNSADVGGGVRVTQQSLTIDRGRFEQNSSRVGGGLAVSVNAGNVQTLEINNSTFIDNSATCQSSIGICHGGGVYAFDLPVSIVGTHFENNRVLDVFDNDDGNGGGIYLSRAFNNSTLTLTNTDFISNSAQVNGGGAYANNQAFVTGGRFERNAAGGNETAFSDGGGGLRALSAVVSGTQFIQNSSGEDGGGLHVRLDAGITNAQFQFNQAITNGGGVFVDFGGMLTLTNTQFISNSAGMKGGGAYASLKAQVSGGRFEDNRADGPENNGGFLTSENGGGGLWVGNDLTLTGAEFSGNVAETNGGGAHVRGKAVLSGGQFEQNQALGNFIFSQSYGGGGLYAANTLAFTGTVFSGNQAAFLGGGVWVSQDVSGFDGLFQNNTGARAGGGLFTLNNLTLTGTRLISNEAGLTGGGALVNGAANLSNALFQANQTVSTSLATSGGGLRVSDGFTATDTQFISNSTTGIGGGASSFGPVTLVDSLFQGNASQRNGGALSASFDPVVANNSRFVKNRAEASGGGVSAAGSIYLTDSLVQNNHAITNGGGLNTSGSIFMTTTQIISNSAGENGGGIWANSGLNGIDGQIANNSSGSSGGGYYGRLAGVTINGTAFTNNQAGADGGGAYAFDGRAIGQALFEGNTAAGAGGGLFLQRFVHITATRFLGNAADLGGGLAVSRTNTGTFVQFVHNSLFARNTATSSGAGLYWNQPRPIDLVHNTIAAPALTPGAAIHIVAGTVKITNSVIASHTTGIEVAGGAVTENYSLFAGNTTNTSGPVGGGLGSLTGNPAFQNPANDDYHLTNASQAINLGIAAGINTDFENDPRPNIGGFDVGFDETTFAPILWVSKSATPALNAPYRGEITYTVILSNSGNLDAANTMLTDTLPAEVDFDRFIQSNGATLTFSFVVSHTGNFEDVFTNTVEFEQVASNSSGTASAMVTVEPQVADLLVSKSSVRDDEAAVITYTILVQNLGPHDAGGVTVSDPIPAGISAFSWQCFPSGGATCTASGTGNISDTLTSFPVGGQAIYTVQATMVSTGATVVNTATLWLPPGLTNTAPTNSAIDTSAPVYHSFLPIIFSNAGG